MKASKKPLTKLAPKPAAAPSKGSVITPTDKEKQTLLEMNTELITLRVRHSELDGQLRALAEKAEQAFNSVRNQEDALKESARGIVKAHGKDPLAKWHVDFQTLRISQVD